jgi:hypothetical protein
MILGFTLKGGLGGIKIPNTPIPDFKKQGEKKT